MTNTEVHVVRAMESPLRVRFLDDRKYLHPRGRDRIQRADGQQAGRLLALVSAAVILLAGEQRGFSRDFEVHLTLQANGADDYWNKRLAFSPDGKLLVIAGDSVLQLRVWDLEKNKERVFLNKEGQRFIFRSRCLAFSPNGDTLALGCLGGICLLDVASGKEKERIPTGFLEYPSLVAFTLDDKSLVAAFRDKAIVIVWDLAHHSERKRITIIGGGRTAITPDCKTLATRGRDEIRIWQLETGKQVVASLQAEKSPFIYQPLRFAPDGNLLVTGMAMNEKMHLWNVKRKKRIAILECPSQGDWWSPPAFSPDGRTLAAIESKGALHLWEIASRSDRAILRDGDKRFFGPVAFSPDGRMLAAGCVGLSKSNKYSILLWDLAIPKRKPPDAKEIDRLWAALRGEDAVAAYRAIRTLTAFPAQTLPLLRKQLLPLSIAAEETHKLESWVAELDSDDFATREKANKKLEDAGLRAEATLHRVLAKHPSLELRQRVLKLLEDIDRQKNVNLIQQLRAMEVLEHIGTTGARSLLAELANDAPETRLTQEAKASLARLKMRPIARHGGSVGTKQRTLPR